MKRLESSFLPANFPAQRAIMLASKPCDHSAQRQVIPRIYLDIDAV
jgi:hypothetical protein